MAVVKWIGPASAFKLGIVVYGLLGLIAGILCSVVAFAGIPFGPHAHLPRVIGVFAVVLCPIFYGILGGVFAVISALLYNLAAGWVGGLEVELK